MGKEIERKFTVLSDSWRTDVQSSLRYRQGYLASDPSCSVRVRVDGTHATLNIKSATLGIERSEYEYEIPLNEANEMLNTLCHAPIIEKTRHFVPHGAHCWEIDVFEGENAGLVVAELELTHADEGFERPDWLGEDVSMDSRYYNVCLVTHPFKDWS